MRTEWAPVELADFWKCGFGILAADIGRLMWQYIKKTLERSTRVKPVIKFNKKMSMKDDLI